MSGTVSLGAGVTDGAADGTGVSAGAVLGAGEGSPLGVAEGWDSTGSTGEALGAGVAGAVSAGAEGEGAGDGVVMMAPSAAVSPYLAAS